MTTSRKLPQFSATLNRSVPSTLHLLLSVGTNLSRPSFWCSAARCVILFVRFRFPSCQPRTSHFCTRSKHRNSTGILSQVAIGVMGPSFNHSAPSLSNRLGSTKEPYLDVRIQQKNRVCHRITVTDTKNLLQTTRSLLPKITTAYCPKPLRFLTRNA